MLLVIDATFYIHSLHGNSCHWQRCQQTHLVGLCETKLVSTGTQLEFYFFKPGAVQVSGPGDMKILARCEGGWVHREMWKNMCVCVCEIRYCRFLDRCVVPKWNEVMYRDDTQFPPVANIRIFIIYSFPLVDFWMSWMTLPMKVEQFDALGNTFSTVPRRAKWDLSKCHSREKKCNGSTTQLKSLSMC